MARTPSIIFRGSNIVENIIIDIEMLRTSCHLLFIHLLLRVYPFFQGDKERRNHVELVDSWSSGVVLILSTLFAKRRQFRELVPLDFANLLPSARLEIGVHWDVAKDVETKLLLPH